MKRLLTLAAVAACSCAFAQQPPAKPDYKAPAEKSAPSSTTSKFATYCSKEAGFCLSYPHTWKRLGEVFEGSGVVVALPKQGEAEEAWPQVTASAVALPETAEGKEPTSFDDVVNVVLESLEPEAQKQTLSRTTLTLDGFAAQRARVQYKDRAGSTWIEDVVFIDGDDVVYSVALRCRPEELGPLVPTYEQMLRSWKVADTSAPAKPEQAKPAPPKQ